MYCSYTEKRNDQGYEEIKNGKAGGIDGMVEILKIDIDKAAHCLEKIFWSNLNQDNMPSIFETKFLMENPKERWYI